MRLAAGDSGAHGAPPTIAPADRMTAMRLRPTSPNAEGDTAAYLFRPICGAPPALSAASAGRARIPPPARRPRCDSCDAAAHRADSVGLAAGALLEVGDDLVLVAQRGQPAAGRQLGHVEHAALQQLLHLRAAGARPPQQQAAPGRAGGSAVTVSCVNRCYECQLPSAVQGRAWLSRQAAPG